MSRVVQTAACGRLSQIYKDHVNLYEIHSYREQQLLEVEDKYFSFFLENISTKISYREYAPVIGFPEHDYPNKGLPMLRQFVTDKI